METNEHTDQLTNLRSLDYTIYISARRSLERQRHLEALRGLEAEHSET